MRLSTSTWLLAGLCCAAQTLAHESLPTPTITPPSGARLDDLIPSATPFPTHPDLRARQNLGVDQNPAAAPQQVPPVTVYSIVSQVGATGAVEIYTYTQLFVAVPDQFPVAQVGTIGYGTDRRRKREAVNTETIEQPVVLALQTVVMTRRLRRVTRLTVVETMIVGNYTAGNYTAWNSTTNTASNASLPVSLATGVYPVPLRRAVAVSLRPLP